MNLTLQERQMRVESAITALDDNHKLGLLAHLVGGMRCYTMPRYRLNSADDKPGDFLLQRWEAQLDIKDTPCETRERKSPVTPGKTGKAGLPWKRRNASGAKGRAGGRKSRRT